MFIRCNSRFVATERANNAVYWWSYRRPSTHKVCYRPVFDVETLLTPPPDPFNLSHSNHNKVCKQSPSLVCVRRHCHTTSYILVKVITGLCGSSELFS